MTRHTTTTCLAAIAIGALLGGCGALKEFDKFSLKGMLKGLWGPTPREHVKRLGSADADVRREAIVALSETKRGLQEPYLGGYALWLKQDSDPSVRSVAVRALGLAGDRKYLPDIVAALADRHDSVRWDAAVALDSVTGLEALPALQLRARRDQVVDVRQSAARALRHYRDPDAIDTLAACMLDEDFTVRYEAHRSLTEMTGTDLGYDALAWARADKVELLKNPPALPLKNRPWWDLMRVTKRDQPTTRPAGG